jgi:3-dehydroquinate synthase
MNVDQFLELMAVDKKVLDGVLRLVLMQDIGKAVVTNDYTESQLRAAIQSSYA